MLYLHFDISTLPQFNKAQIPYIYITPRGIIVYSKKFVPTILTDDTVTFGLLINQYNMDLKNK